MIDDMLPQNWSTLHSYIMDLRFRHSTKTPGTYMCLIALDAWALASWNDAERETKGGYFTKTFSQEAENCEYGADIENGHLDLHRQVDAQGFVLSETAAISTRAATPRIGKHFTANAYQNPSQSRIRGLNRPERDAIENYCCRVFVDSTWKNDHRSTQRHVPLGKAEPEESEG